MDAAGNFTPPWHEIGQVRAQDRHRMRCKEEFFISAITTEISANRSGI